MRTHGMSGTREHKSWEAMRSRCNNKNNRHYRDYGGRGIAICAGWNEFQSFYNDMGDRPSGHSIDRIDNDGGYWCGRCDECIDLGRRFNCRWATPVQQLHNTRRDKFRRQTYSRYFEKHDSLWWPALEDKLTDDIREQVSEELGVKFITTLESLGDLSADNYVEPSLDSPHGEREVRSLEDIGAGLNLTRERVRQIEAIALSKMRLGLGAAVDARRSAPVSASKAQGRTKVGAKHRKDRAA